MFTPINVCCLWSVNAASLLCELVLDLFLQTVPVLGLRHILLPRSALGGLLHLSLDAKLGSVVSTLATVLAVSTM